MANFNFNKVILGGRLTADPELKTTPSGISVCTFVLAAARNYKTPDGQTPADFPSVTAWRGTAEFITRYFRKGSSICITGSIQTRSWTDQAGQKRFATSVIADEAYFVDALKDSPMGGSSPSANSKSNSDVEVDPNSPMLVGIDPGAAPGKAAPQAFCTPGARGQFEGIEDDGELPF